MNQITQMFKESNSRMSQIVKGKFDAEAIEKGQREAEIQVKICNVVVSMYGIGEKSKRALKDFKSMNIIEPTTAIGILGDPEVDKVKCPYHDNLITRAECLDYSGENMDTCSGCETGIETKRMLITP